MHLRKLPALAVVLCLLACEALAGGMSRCACCTARPCCPAMTGGKGAAGAACAMHRADSGGRSCALRPADPGLAIVHVHQELQPRPAVFARADAASLSGLTARLPEPAFQFPASPAARPETPPPRFLQVV